jgi:hypothetical protein
VAALQQTDLPQLEDPAQEIPQVMPRHDTPPEQAAGPLQLIEPSEASLSTVPAHAVCPEHSSWQWAPWQAMEPAQLSRPAQVMVPVTAPPTTPPAQAESPPHRTEQLAPEQRTAPAHEPSPAQVTRH